MVEIVASGDLVYCKDGNKIAKVKDMKIISYKKISLDDIDRIMKHVPATKGNLGGKPPKVQ